jgi:hypothetical protein
VEGSSAEEARTGWRRLHVRAVGDQKFGDRTFDGLFRSAGWIFLARVPVRAPDEQAARLCAVSAAGCALRPPGLLDLLPAEGENLLDETECHQAAFAWRGAATSRSPSWPVTVASTISPGAAGLDDGQG